MASYTYGFGKAYSYGGIGSVALAEIIYNMDTFNVDVSSLRTIDNAGSLGATSDALMYGSNHINLGATQYVDYNIPYTLTGTDIVVNGTFSADTNWTKGTGWTISAGKAIKTAGVAGILSQTAPSSFATGISYVVYFTVSDRTAGSIQLQLGQDTQATTVAISANGNYKYTLTLAASGTNFIDFLPTADFAGKIDNVMIGDNLQLTNTNSYTTYYNVATKQFVTFDNSAFNPSRKTYQLTANQHHSNVFTTTVPLTDTDRTNLNMYPEDIARMKAGISTKGTYSFGIGDIYSWYPANEGLLSGKYVQDVKSELGSELVVNGGFDTDLSGWTLESSNGTIPIWDNASAFVSVNGTLNNQYSRLTIANYASFTAGDIVRCEINVSNLIGTILFSPIYNQSSLTHNITTNGTTVLFFTIISTGLKYILCGINNLGIGLVASANINWVSVRKATASEIYNYTDSSRTTLRNTNYGASNLLYKTDGSGRFIGMADNGTIEVKAKSENFKIPTRTHTANITLEITPRVVASIALMTTTTAGTISMVSNGTVTASSGTVSIDTTTLQVGVKSIVTVSGIYINGISTFFALFDGVCHNYQEEII